MSIKKYNYISHDSHGNPVLDVSSLLTYEDVIVLAENGLMDEEGYLISDIDQYLVEQENYELNEVLKKLKSAAKKAGKHVWKHKKKYAAGALAVGGAALIGKTKLKARQNRRNETQAAAANQRLADDEAKAAERTRRERESTNNAAAAKKAEEEKAAREAEANNAAAAKKAEEEKTAKGREKYNLPKGRDQVDAKGNAIDRKGNEERKELLQDKKRARGQAKVEYQAADNVPTVKGSKEGDKDHEAQKGWEKRMTKRGANLATGNAPVVDNKVSTRREGEDADSTSTRNLDKLKKHTAKKAKKDKGRQKRIQSGERVEHYRNSNVDYDLRSIADAYMDQVVGQSYVEESENLYAENIKESLKSRLGSAAIGAGVGAASGAATHAANWLRDKNRTWAIDRLKKKGKKMSKHDRATLRALRGDKMQDAYQGRKLGKKELLKKMLGGAALVGGATAIQDPLGQMGKYGVVSEYEPEGEQIEEKKKRDWSKDTPYLLRDLKTADKITSSLGKEYKKNAAQRKKNWKKVGKAVGKTKVGKFGKALWKKGAAANKKAKQNRDNYYSGKDYKDVMGNTKKGYNNYL